MKKFNRYSVITTLAATLTIALVFGLSGIAMAATYAVGLGTADSFAVLAGTAVTNVPTSVITGNVGLSPAAGSNYAGLTSAEVTGTIYAVDGSGPGGSVNNPALLTTAKNDLTAAYLDAAGRTPTQTFVAGDNQLGGQTLTAGVYAFGHATSANITAASPLTLDAQGNSSAVFIFQASSDLVTASSSVVRLVNGAQDCNVFWQVTSSVTLGTSSTFIGTVMALTSITDNGSSTINGRLLARNAQVALNTTTIRRPTCVAAAAPAATATPTATAAAGLPKTGVESSSQTGGTPWNIIIPAAAVVGVSALFIARKKRTI